jgi:hypothetical protein
VAASSGVATPKAIQAGGCSRSTRVSQMHQSQDKTIQTAPPLHTLNWLRIPDGSGIENEPLPN